MPTPVYADHPFSLIESPLYRQKKESGNTDADAILYCASEMCHIHGLIIRWLNSIYLQAPHIKPADEKPFLQYMAGWHQLIHLHHHEEEEDFFPWVEELTGVKDIMEGNVQQHQAFHGGLDKFITYVKDVQAGKETYDGKKVVKIIDEFGAILAQHLADEIPTLLGLKEYGEEKFKTMKERFDAMGQRSMASCSFRILTAAFANIDVHFEDDIWSQWPPAPGVVKFLIRNVSWKMNSDVTKFGAVDKSGKLQPLYAVA
ncbi:hypothetical protein B0H66DRAFT_568837 [Apodospora peruviana]|uniref:Hemerythrin-like domain-containing protein n=1 Tax=Apodospora peruviana TaxID=516989 RepID=A0AAE0HUD0_9PEZI|nr:hypothetical protein B0H66DRAFT_568837 [Apodospora peruviana]